MELSQRDQDALTALAFNISSSPGEYALLLGAGVSVSSGIPSAWNLLMDLVMKRASVVSTDIENPKGWFVERYGKEPTYQGFLQEMAATKFERQALLKQYFDPEQNNGAKPTEAHRSIARLVKSGKIRLILTINFDHLMEEALFAEGINPTVVTTPEQLGGSLRAPHAYRCLVVHLHGDFLSPASMLNTVGELEQYHPDLNEFLARVFADYGLVIAGWSAEYDEALVGTISSHYRGQYAVTWVEPRFELNPTAEQLLQRVSHGRHVKATADDALGFLESAVQAIEDARARHPHSVAVAAAIAKRDLEGRQTSIRLHDLLQNELRLLEALPELNVPSEGPTGDHPGREGGSVAATRRLAHAAEVPAAILAVLAYWGRTEEADAWVIEAILRFAQRDDRHWDNSLADAPLVIAQLLYRAAACGAVAAGRWDLAWKLIYLEHPDSKESWPQASLGTKFQDPGPVAAGELRAYPLLSPVLEEALLISAEAVGKAWERFDVARYFDQGYNNVSHPSALPRISDLRDQVYKTAAELGDAEASGEGIDEAKTKHQGTSAALKLALRELLHVDLWDAHLRADSDVTLGVTCPAAHQMVNDSDDWSAGHRLASWETIFVKSGTTSSRTGGAKALGGITLSVWTEALPVVLESLDIHVAEAFHERHRQKRIPPRIGTYWLDEL